MNDTIAAIATSIGGPISIIRISGDDSIKIVNEIFQGENLCQVPGHTIHYGHIINKAEVIDEVLVSIFLAPKTFTMEDVVEINGHGGIIATKKILQLVLDKGCRLAEPGEFTKRAFLNGRIDLIEAESVMELINAKTEKAHTLAINQLSGKVSNKIDLLREDILQILANIEVNIDYPEYEDIEQVTISTITTKIEDIDNKIQTIIRDSQNGKIIKNGINVGIIGKPNVGKSSLLNNLLDEDKAIVTDIEGTTRDYVEGTLNFEGIMLNIIDTAGIRQTEDIVEKIGVQKSFEIINKSDLILFMLNNNDYITDEEKTIYDQIKSKHHLIIVNKSDLPKQLELSYFDKSNIVFMSIQDNKGIEILLEKIKKMYHFEEIEENDLTYLSDARSISILNQVSEAIKDIKSGIANNLPIDMIEIDIKNIWNLLGTIVGKTYEDELINKLFSQFCLGK